MPRIVRETAKNVAERCATVARCHSLTADGRRCRLSCRPVSNAAPPKGVRRPTRRRSPGVTTPPVGHIPCATVPACHGHGIPMRSRKARGATPSHHAKRSGLTSLGRRERRGGQPRAPRSSHRALGCNVAPSSSSQGGFARRWAGGATQHSTTTDEQEARRSRDDAAGRSRDDARTTALARAVASRVGVRLPRLAVTLQWGTHVRVLPPALPQAPGHD